MSTTKNFKIWTAVPGGPGVMATEQEAYLIGSKTNFVAASSAGVAVMGKSITMGTTGENIRQGGLFVGMNDFIRMIPSTIVTPIPPQIPFPPLGMISTVMKDLPFFIAMMVGSMV